MPFSGTWRVTYLKTAAVQAWGYAVRARTQRRRQSLPPLPAHNWGLLPCLRRGGRLTPDVTPCPRLHAPAFKSSSLCLPVLINRGVFLPSRTLFNIQQSPCHRPCRHYYQEVSRRSSFSEGMASRSMPSACLVFQSPY